MSKPLLTISNALNADGKTIDLSLESTSAQDLDASGLVLIPALIDPHVHFRTPGLEHKENWESGALAAIHGGVTTVFDMPNTLPPTITQQRLQEKKGLIDKQLDAAKIPLNYGLYLGADKSHFEEIPRCKQDCVALKVFMGSSTGDLVMDDEGSLHAAFSLCAQNDLLLAVHAEDEALIQERKAGFPHADHPRFHSLIRNDEVAYRATHKAIELARLYKTRLYLLHIGTKREVELIRKAKEEGLSFFAETTPHHLFLTQDAYETLGTKVQMNPPLRREEDRLALWEAIRSGVIDTIGSDHAPHTLKEKALPYGKAPSGIPGVETTLPLLLNAASQGQITLNQIIRLMRTRVQEIFRIPPNDDWVLLDLNKTKVLDEANLKTRCGWSPYAGLSLTGWPVKTILKGQIYDLS